MRITFCLIAGLATLLTAANSLGAPVGSAPIKRGFYALKSGNIDGPIWAQADETGKVPASIDRKLRPGEDAELSIGASNLTITVSTPITVRFYQHRGDRVRTVIKEGA